MIMPRRSLQLKNRNDYQTDFSQGWDGADLGHKGFDVCVLSAGLFLLLRDEGVTNWK